MSLVHICVVAVVVAYPPTHSFYLNMNIKNKLLRKCLKQTPQKYMMASGKVQLLVLLLVVAAAVVVASSSIVYIIHLAFNGLISPLTKVNG